jgi:hypothetical protein
LPCMIIKYVFHPPGNPHSSHCFTYGPIQGGYENRANAVELSGRGGDDLISFGIGIFVGNVL